MSTKTKRSNRAVGFILLFAIGLEIVALIFGGFAVAVFGLLMAIIGYAIIPVGFMYDREGWLKAMPDELADSEPEAT